MAAAIVTIENTKYKPGVAELCCQYIQILEIKQPDEPEASPFYNYMYFRIKQQ